MSEKHKRLGHIISFLCGTPNRIPDELSSTTGKEVTPILEKPLTALIWTEMA